jgi:predicted DNA-binding transcriptional regulator AlpA
MSEQGKIIPLRKAEARSDDKTMIVTMSAGELRELIRQEVQAIGRNSVEEDEWIDIEKAAKLMSVSPEWLYHNRKNLPFASKIGRRLLRFSRNGLQRWMQSRKA